MSYSMVGLGDDAACSPTGPPNAFKLVNGVAKPTNCTALAAFEAFQSELSRFGAIRVDGDIGQETVKAYAKLTGTSQTAAGIATGIPINTGLLKLKATGEGKPAAKALPPIRAVKKSDGTVEDVNAPPKPFLDTAMEFVTSPMGMLAVAGGIGLLLFATRRKGSPAVAPALVPIKVP